MGDASPRKWLLRDASLSAPLTCPTCSWGEGSADVLAVTCSKYWKKTVEETRGKLHYLRQTCPCSLLSSGELVFIMAMQQWDPEPAEHNAKPPDCGDPHKTAVGPLHCPL